MVPQYAVMQPANQLTFLHDEWLMAGFIREPFCHSAGLHWWLFLASKAEGQPHSVCLLHRFKHYQASALCIPIHVHKPQYSLKGISRASFVPTSF